MEQNTIHKVSKILDLHLHYHNHKFILFHFSLSNFVLLQFISGYFLRLFSKEVASAISWFALEVHT